MIETEAGTVLPIDTMTSRSNRLAVHKYGKILNASLVCNPTVTQCRCKWASSPLLHLVVYHTKVDRNRAHQMLLPYLFSEAYRDVLVYSSAS